MTPGDRPHAAVRSLAVVAGALAVAAAACMVASRFAAFHALPFLAPDSASYLNGDVGRTPAYPLLLRIVPLAWLGTVQLAAMTASAAWLAVALSTVIPAALAVGVECAIVFNPALVAYAFTVLPEGFFISAEQVHIALAIRLVQSPSRGAGIAFGMVTAGLILLKPSGYSFVVAACALVWLIRNQKFGIGIPVLVSLASVLLSASAFNFARNGVFATQAYGGYALIGYVGQLLDERTPTSYPDLAATLVERTAQTRNELRRISAPDLYYMASSSAYHDVLDVARPAILDYIRRADPALGERDAFVTLNTIAQSLALSAIRQHPAAYAWHAGTHFYGLWSMPLIQNRSDADRMTTRLAALAQTAPHTLRTPIMYRLVPSPIYWAITGLLFGALAASIAGLIYAVCGAHDAVTAVLAYAAVSAHANFALVSAVQPGLPRYALAMWPTLMVLAAAGAAIAGSWFRTRVLETTRRDDRSAG
jgi:hypothetical protein